MFIWLSCGQKLLMLLIYQGGGGGGEILPPPSLKCCFGFCTFWDSLFSVSPSWEILNQYELSWKWQHGGDLNIVLTTEGWLNLERVNSQAAPFCSGGALWHPILTGPVLWDALPCCKVATHWLGVIVGVSGSVYWWPFAQGSREVEDVRSPCASPLFVLAWLQIECLWVVKPLLIW